MSQPKLVSAITAVYNMGRYLPEAIDSILGQDYPRVESIIVDDGSTDETGKVLKAYEGDPRVTIIRQQNAGQTVAKNRGIQAAHGEYIGFCDADDSWLPDKLSKQVPCFDPEGRVGVVFGDALAIGEHGESLPIPHIPRCGGRITGKLLADNFVPFPTALIRRQAMEDFGPFNENYRMGIDLDLWLRISTRYEFHYLNEFLVRYRIWPGQMSKNTVERFEWFFRIFEDFLSAHPESVTPEEIRRAAAHTFVSRGIWHVQEGRGWEALRDFGRGFRKRPLDLRLWKSLVKSPFWFLRANLQAHPST